MNESDQGRFDDFVNGAPQRGSFSFSEARRQTWQCPFCDHTLSYQDKTKSVAELAANSHISRQHKNERLIVLLPDIPEQPGVP